MKSHRKSAAIIGALFLISNVTFLLGAFLFVEPVLTAPDYLTLSSANRNQVVLGALLEIVNGVAYIGIAVLVFSILRKRFESLALWYVCFRIIEFIMQILSDLSALSIVKLGEEFVKAGAPASSSFEIVGAFLLSQRYWAFQMVTFSLVLGAVVLYYMLYQTNLIPRFISVWGLIAAIAVISTALMDTFGISPGYLEFLGLLMLLNELFIGVWLIAKGFNSTEVAAVYTE
ncbi:MAG: DUF4386 domain-containing protein [Chloroflexi bacterium]|nr:MAG: DUF4386 domain-containing protein [Chloroflexota bacterium]MBL1192735.1 DUF4386 domain-containing protein [Chloroflexota bacterium]NOH10027.1 DUF4386 domain-containing protein [Chloroflexota bacterium]